MPMYFVQHGKAVAKEIDPDRPLSEAGRLEVERVGACLRHMGLTFRGVYHSGKTRARQTAEILTSELGLDYISEVTGMNPNDDVVEFSEGLQNSAMYVGHLPHLGKLVSYLVTGNEAADVVAFSNGGVVCVDRADGVCRIDWMVTPEVCCGRSWMTRRGAVFGYFSSSYVSINEYEYCRPSPAPHPLQQ